jgi:hypothetical protein
VIYRNDADVLGSCHSLFLANHRSSNQIALMEKENLKLTNTISFLITDDLKKNTKHESNISRQHYHNNCNLVNKPKT